MRLLFFYYCLGRFFFMLPCWAGKYHTVWYPLGPAEWARGTGRMGSWDWHGIGRMGSLPAEWARGHLRLAAIFADLWFPLFFGVICRICMVHTSRVAHVHRF